MPDPDQQHHPKLFCAVDMTEPESSVLAGGTVAVLSARCPGKESDNEDCAAIIPIDEGTAVIAVADGMGGAAAGELASRLAVEAIKNAVLDDFNDGVILRTAILNGFEKANQSICELGIGAATTLAVVEIADNSIRPYHVGDSLILLVGGRGKIKLQTISHSPVGYAVEAGMLNDSEAIHHEDRHVISNALGMDNMRIEIGPTIRFARRDTLLLASDGLSDNLHLNEIVTSASKGLPSNIAADLHACARQRMIEPSGENPSKPDDLSIVIFRNK